MPAEVAEQADAWFKFRRQSDAKSDDASTAVIERDRERNPLTLVELVLAPAIDLCARFAHALTYGDPVVVIKDVVDKPTDGFEKGTKIIVEE